MNKIIFSTIFLFSILRGFSQSTLNETRLIPANSKIISNDTTFSLPQPGGYQTPIYVCAGKTLNLTGFSTHICRIFLENNAKVIVDDTFNFYLVAKIFMKAGSELDWNRKLGSSIDTLLEEANAILIDTGKNSIQHHIVTSNLTFDYSQFPGNAAPCSVLNHINRKTESNSFKVQPNPSYDGFVHITGVNFHKPSLNYTVHSIYGQLLKTGNIKDGYCTLDLDTNYPVQILQIEGHPLQKVIIMK
jgi:hypothetical protein